MARPGPAAGAALRRSVTSRKSLDTAPDGSPHFPDAELDRYRLGESVATDYERFIAAVAPARRDPGGAIDHLSHALMLVRGVPLSATENAWATNELYTLAQEVVDAAHDLMEAASATANTARLSTPP